MRPNYIKSAATLKDERKSRELFPKRWLILSGRRYQMKHRVLFAIGLSAALLPGIAPAAEGPKLAGLWGCERLLGPAVRGELTIEEGDSGWRAMIAGYDVPAKVDRDTITFRLPGGASDFRGHLSADRREIVGHWIQPKTVLGGARYATPVALTAIANHHWRGQMQPLQDRESFYLMVSARADGTYDACLRNPEHNLGIRFGTIHLTVEGNAVRFSMRPGMPPVLTGKLAGNRLIIDSAALGMTLDFTRRGRDEAVGFYPRTPAEATYTYRPPIGEDDGWSTASLSDVGLDPAPIAGIVRNVLGTKTEGVRTPYLQGLLVARHGKLALEEYFYGFYKDRPHDTRSSGKTIASTLIGIAIDKGASFGLSTPVCDLFPEYTKLAHDEPRKRQITVQHLLTMSSGLDCDDNNDASPGQEDTMQEQTAQPDWYKFTLDLPMVRAPGAKAVYGSAQINLLGGILLNKTGMWVPDFLYQNFAKPLDIHRYHVNLMPTGNAYMAGGIYIRPRDMMKLGQLFLDGGRWHGRQVVSSQWVENATRPHAGINGKDDYGFAWWLRTYRVGDQQYRAFYASGNGGQQVFVIPQLDMVIMFTAGNYNNFPVWRNFGDVLVPQIIAAARR